ncbi:PspA-associated protein PspAB [Streptomyces albogriseolus]
MGSFCPFATLPGHQRDSPLELQAKAVVKDDLRTEQDSSRRSPLGGAPGL